MKRKLPWVLSAVLALLLVITNAFWLYANIDQGVTLAYRDQEVSNQCHALRECMAILPGIAAGRSRAEVLGAARKAAADPDEFEKEGAVWLGGLGFRFAGERLSAVVPAWEPFECPD